MRTKYFLPLWMFAYVFTKSIPAVYSFPQDYSSSVQQVYQQGRLGGNQRGSSGCRGSAFVFNLGCKKACCNGQPPAPQPTPPGSPPACNSDPLPCSCHPKMEDGKIYMCNAKTNTWEAVPIPDSSPRWLPPGLLQSSWQPMGTAVQPSFLPAPMMVEQPSPIPVIPPSGLGYPQLQTVQNYYGMQKMPPQYLTIPLNSPEGSKIATINMGDQEEQASEHMVSVQNTEDLLPSPEAYTTVEVEKESGGKRKKGRKTKTSPVPVSLV